MVVGVVGTIIGLATWIVTMASAPRYSHAPEDLGHGDVLIGVLLIAAVVGGVLQPGHPWLVGLTLGLPGLLLSPWTTPRGDNDGLWGVSIVIMAILLLFLVFAAGVGVRRGVGLHDDHIAHSCRSALRSATAPKDITVARPRPR
jgi:hypothetical protein